ncbi:transglutaminaseTgpA domain-containing protein [Lentzea sp. NPDC006480]|uniref:transglutaminase family protein n=1 Tax=Lentzea sp. NPDC006480 TaxID=3157176 RepID=UPI0033A2A987
MTRMVQVVVCVLAVAMSDLLYLSFFDTTAFVPAAGATVLVAAGAACLVHKRSLALRLGAACLGFVVTAVPAALRPTFDGWRPTTRTVSELGWGVVGGWARMLSVGLPSPVDDEILVGLLFVTWIATFSAVIMVLCTKSVLAPLLPPMLSFVLGLLMVASRQQVHWYETAGLGGLLITLLLLRSTKTTRARGVYATVALVLSATSVGIAIGVTGVLADGAGRADPRPLYSVPLKNPEVITPLSTVKAQLLEEPRRRLFSARVTDADGLIGLRVAALDRFDGALWTSREDFLVAGERLGRDRSLGPSRTVRATITVDSLPNTFLPVAGWPVETRFARSVGSTGFSPASGSLIVEEPLPRGTSYDVVGEFQSARDLSRDARPSTTEADHAYTDLPPGLPAPVASLAHALTDSEPSPVGKLAALESHLRGLPYNVEAPPGHSYAAINKLLTAPQTHDDEGDAEQHVAAFAVMARSLGFPTRIAVGYRVRPEVTTRDAHAWAEIHFEGHGWVAYDPTDPDRLQRSTPDQPVVVPTPSPNPESGHNQAVPTTTAPPTPPPPPLPSDDRFWLVLVVLAAVVLLSVLVIPAEKLRRRWVRRRARTGPALVTGAWEEAVDRLVERKLPFVLSRTPRQVAGNAVETLGEPAISVVALAETTTTAIFGPEFLGDCEPGQAWLLERSLRRDLYPGWRRLWRLRAWFDPVPLYVRRAEKRRQRT